MSTYTNCILESHNVLPSAPLNFTVGPITSTWAVLNWRSPKRHAKSLQGYRIFWRRFDRPLQLETNSSSAGVTAKNSSLLGDTSNDEFYYSSAEAATNPYLLDALQSNTVYETFVVAVNRYGQSDSSVRFVFQTLAEPSESDMVDSGGVSSSSGDDVESRLPLHGNSTSLNRQSYYNETDCCMKSGVHDACKQLCDYDMKVSDVPSLMTHCNSQMPVILRCMAGSRNSVPCCRSRGVSDHCLNVCAGLTEQSPLVVATRCASDFGKMMRCMDEGSKQIPGAPVDLHTVEVKPDRISLKWAPSSEDSLRTDIEYHVRYQQLQPSSSEPPSQDLTALIAVVPLHPLEHNLVSSTNRTEATMDKLKPNSRYSIYVTAENSYGISLPSLVLVVQTPDENSERQDDYNRRATLGSPHSLEILRSDTETIVLKWIAPLFISSDAQIKYRVFYKMLQAQNQTEDAIASTSGASSESEASSRQVAGNWSVLETNDTTALLRNLRYSSQYVITVQAYSKQMLGHMSEILLAQTAKPIPPTLNHPLVINNPIEGNNITIMCVALGQPTPQISMFINGLLVQKRTQPYVFYHLVNLVRGHLTITCFASNGHGKDYASVQSRTEVSVKFPTNATAKAKQIRASLQSLARMTCEVSGNPQPTVVWTFTPNSSLAGGSISSSSSPLVEIQEPKSTVITPGDRITTLLVSKFENPFTWSHTLTLRNISQSDLGTYQCRAKNVLSESSDSIQLVGLEDSENNPTDSSSYMKLVEQNSDLMECCKSQNVSAKCLPVCSLDGLDVESAFKIPECQIHLDKLMFCAADGSDHRNCCRTRQVPTSCLRWCSGARLNSPALCFLSSAIDINQCFQEGRTLLPGPPRNVRVMLASESDHSSELDSAAPASEVSTTTMAGNGIFTRIQSPSVMSMGDHSESSQPSGEESAQLLANPNGGGDDAASESLQQHSEPLIIEWDPPVKNPALTQYYRIFWRPFGSRELSRTLTNLTWIKLNDLSMNKMYEFVVKAANQHGSSVYSDMLTVKPAEILAQSNSIGAAGLIWFMPSTSGGGSSLIGRVLMAVCFATVFMFSSLALVVLLEKRGYLRRFASSKSNSSRVSFANPAYLKDSDGNNQDGDNITWGQGPAHSLDILAPPPSSPTSQATTPQTNVLT